MEASYNTENLHSCSTGQIINAYKISACHDVSIKNYSIFSKKFKEPGANEQCAIMYFFNILHFVSFLPLYSHYLEMLSLIFWELFKRKYVSIFFSISCKDPFKRIAIKLSCFEERQSS